jgi:TetR/AcrR family fatty acid metabolism transcriptional regulator
MTDWSVLKGSKMSPKIVDKKTKREMIMKAALAVFAEQGTEATKMADIASRANVGKGTLYEYFPSKQDLIAGAMEMMMDELDTYLGARLIRVTGPMATIRTVIGSTFEYFVEQQDRVNVLTDMWAAAVPRRDGKPLLGNIGPRFDEFRKWVAAIIDDGIRQNIFRPVDSEKVASILLATLDGLLFQAMLGVLPEDHSDMPERICELFLEGIKAE